MPNTIWVDADACPVVIKEILIKAARRTGTELVFVANQPLRMPKAPNIRMITVKAGFDVADNEIVQQSRSGDLIITADTPLASEVIDKGATALSPRGELYTEDNIKSRVNMRDFLETMRASGVNTGGPPALNQNDRKRFAGHLDSWLAKNR